MIAGDQAKENILVTVFTSTPVRNSHPPSEIRESCKEGACEVTPVMQSKDFLAGPESQVKLVGKDIEAQIFLKSDSGDGGSPATNSSLESQSESELSDGSQNSLIKSLRSVHGHVTLFYEGNTQLIHRLLYILLLLAYVGYFIAAVVINPERAIPLMVMTALVFCGAMYSFLSGHFGQRVAKRVINAISENVSIYKILRWVFVVLIAITVIVIIGVSVRHQPSNLISLVGFLVFIFLLFICSHQPTKVIWRPVICGFLLQFFVALIILKWSYGYDAFRFLGRQVQTFLEFTDNGSKFVFGDAFEKHFFAFKVLPIVIFFSCSISVLYYLGVMQAVIGKIAWLMHVTLGTTAAESLCSAGNIFVGQTEAPILIRPYLELMTLSELHAVMTGGFATIAGGVLAAYIFFGVPAEHLLCASVMNAPCALAVSKLMYPETEKSKLRKVSDLPKQEKKECNILEAAANGASASIGLVANIAANLIAFLAMLAFINAMLSWFGSMVDHPELSFQLICSYVFMPVAYLMGVQWKDAGIVGELIGMKTFMNEFIAYKDLSEYMDNRRSCVGPAISARSELIATYALCGFANLSSIGIQLGGIGPMAPNRRGDLASIVIRALISGIMACLLTACVAGLLVVEEESILSCMLNDTLPIGNDTTIFNTSTIINSTVISVFNETYL